MAGTCDETPTAATNEKCGPGELGDTAKPKAEDAISHSHRVRNVSVLPEI